ncbi:TonB-dependent receptor [Vibrio sp. WJH972]
MNNLTTKLTPLALVLFTLSTQAESNLDTIIVTANSADKTISDVAATMWVVDHDQLTKEINTGADLKVALGRLIPGYDFGGESRTNYAQNMRGRSALIMIDGVSLNSTRSISRQLDSISPFNVERVEVLSGATSIYGAGASGGIINIITKKSSVGEAKVELQVGATSSFQDSDDGTKSIAVAISGGSEQLRGRLSASYEGSGASYDANGEMILPDITQTDMQFNEIIDVMANVEFEPDQNQAVSVAAQYYSSKQDTDYTPDLGVLLTKATGSDEITISDELDLDDQPSTERVMVNVQYSNKNVLGHSMLAQAYYRNESMQFFPFPSFDPYNSNGSYYLYGASLQETDILGAKVVLSKEIGDVELNYGIDASKESFSADWLVYDITSAFLSGGTSFTQTDTVQRYPDVETQKIGVFSQAEWQVNQDLRVSGGLRFQYIGHEIGDYTGISQQLIYGDAADEIEGGTTHYTEWLANLGSIYNVNDNQQLWANFSQGFEIPDPAKYYGNGTYSGSTLVSSISVADNELEGVTTNSLELGWRLAQDKIETQLAMYYSLSDKTTSYDSSTYAIIVNDDQKRIYGLEGQLNYHFTDEWYVGLQGHLIESETKSDGSWSNLAAETASPSNALLRAGYDNYDYGADLQLQTIANYHDDDGGELEGYSLVHLSSYYSLPVGKVSFGIQNVLNKDYYTLWSQRAQMLYSGYNESLVSFKGKGRTFAVTYNLEF